MSSFDWIWRLIKRASNLFRFFFAVCWHHDLYTLSSSSFLNLDQFSLESHDGELGAVIAPTMTIKVVTSVLHIKAPFLFSACR